MSSSRCPNLCVHRRKGEEEGREGREERGKDERGERRRGEGKEGREEAVE